MDHRLRVNWAGKHTEALHASIGKFIASQPYELRPYHDSEKRRYVCRFHATKPMPDPWSLMAGDIVHSLRSSLDNLTYAIMLKERKGVLPSLSEIKKIQFPICDSHGEFHGTATKKGGEKKRRLSLFSREAIAAIDGMQPYRTPNPPKPHPLSVLRELTNIDKHRHILFTAANLNPISVIVRSTTGEYLSFACGFHGPFEEGAIGCVFPDTNIDVSPDGKMNMDSNVAVDVLFGDGPPVYGASVRPELLRIRDHIVDFVFKELEPLLH